MSSRTLNPAPKGTSTSLAVALAKLDPWASNAKLKPAELKPSSPATITWALAHAACGEVARGTCARITSSIRPKP